jgi:hypothetical protein
MSARVEWDGLEELKAALRALPAELAAEAAHIVEAKANQADADVTAVYGQHVVTGHLRDRQTVTETQAGPFGVAFEVKNPDPIAWLFDNGSEARHWLGGKSTGVMWGHTPPTHVFVRSMMRRRREMYAQLKALLERKGLVVSGDA